MLFKFINVHVHVFMFDTVGGSDKRLVPWNEQPIYTEDFIGCSFSLFVSVVVVEDS